MTMMLAMAVMFMGNDAKAVNRPAGSEPSEEAMGNESDYGINMESSIMLQVNETITLEPMFIPVTAQTSFTWYSENDIVAKVSPSGVITAQSVGTTEITARAANGKKAKCTVIVSAAAPNPLCDLWVGSYRVTSSIDRGHVSDYDYPNEFNITIYEHDGAFYATGMVGMSLDGTIYEGLKVNVLDGQHAEIDLSYCYDLGYRSWTGCFLNCMYMISPQSTFQPEELEESKIHMTRNSDESLVIDDFYVFAFGLATDYQIALDAAYHNVMCKHVPSSAPSIIVDSEQTENIEVYNINGMLVYSGKEDGIPHLSSGFYLIKLGSGIKKVVIP